MIVLCVSSGDLSTSTTPVTLLKVKEVEDDWKCYWSPSLLLT